MDRNGYTRREFMKVAGLGGLVFASGLPGCASSARRRRTARLLLRAALGRALGLQQREGQPGVAQGTLRKAVAAVNRLEEKPDFVVFTGDLTQTTDDPKVRRQRLASFASRRPS